MKKFFSAFTLIVFIIIVFLRMRSTDIPDTYYYWLNILSPFILYPTFFIFVNFIKMKNSITLDILFFMISCIYLVNESNWTILLFYQVLSFLVGFIIVKITTFIKTNYLV